MWNKFKVKSTLLLLLGSALLIAGCGSDKPLVNNEPKGEYARDIEKAKALEPARAERDQGFENGG